MYKAYIFLDIDGVLNNYSTPAVAINEDITGYALKKSREMGWDGIKELKDKAVYQILHSFNKESMDLIKKLQDEFQAYIIITSSWRVYYSFDQLVSIFKLFNIQIHDTLPLGFPRSEKILNYVYKHNIKNWIVIDDMNMNKNLKWHMVLIHNIFDYKDYEICRRKLYHE